VTYSLAGFVIAKHEDGTLESVRFQGSRDEDIGIANKPKRDHPRLDFFARVALMTWSIWRELSVSVPLRCDSSPITRSTSELRGGKPHIALDAEQHGFRRAALLDDNRPALLLHPTQQFAKIGAGAKRGDHDGVILVGSEHGPQLFSSVITTAFHLTKPGESFADVQRAVGPLVTSECNIFALSVKDPHEMPADIAMI